LTWMALVMGILFAAPLFTYLRETRFAKKEKENASFR
jgi:hypothetical protein